MVSFDFRTCVGIRSDSVTSCIMVDKWYANVAKLLTWSERGQLQMLRFIMFSQSVASFLRHLLVNWHRPERPHVVQPVS